MKFNHARVAGLSALAASLLSACVMSATGQVTPGQVGGSASPSPAASMSPGATASTTPRPSTSPTASASASPAASASPTASPATGGKTGDAEPNDTFNTASAGAWDTPISGKAGMGDDEGDYYKLDVPAGMQDGWLTVTVSEESEDYSPSIQLFKANKASIGNVEYAESATADPTEGKWRVMAGNSYFVKLSPHASDEESVDYTVTFKFTPVADTNERNDTFETAKALTLGTMVKFATFWADDAAAEDMDYFKVTLPAGSNKFRVALKNNTTNDEAGSYNVQFFSAADKESVGNVIYSESQADITGDEGLTDEFEPGEYFVKVEGTNTSALSELTITAVEAEESEEE